MILGNLHIQACSSVNHIKLPKNHMCKSGSHDNTLQLSNKTLQFKIIVITSSVLYVAALIAAHDHIDCHKYTCMYIQEFNSFIATCIYINVYVSDLLWQNIPEQS